MQHRRTDADAFIQRLRDVPFDRQASLLVEERDVAFLAVGRRLSQPIPPGTWQLGHVPMHGDAPVESGGTMVLTFIRSDRHRSLKLEGRLMDGARFFGTVGLKADPQELYMNLLIDPNGDGQAYIQKHLADAIRKALDPLVAEHGPRAAMMISQQFDQLCQSALMELMCFGVNEVELVDFSLKRASGGDDAAGGVAPTGDERIQVIGRLAGKVAQPCPDPSQQKWEQFGLFVAADPAAIRWYNGATPGWRWLGRAAGPLLDAFPDWPRTPDGGFSYHFGSEQEAHAYYAAVRQFALSRAPDLQAQDTRQERGINAASGYAETFWRNGEEVLHLVFDQIECMQAVAFDADVIDIAPAWPPGHSFAPLVAFETASDAIYLAVAKGPNGGADHVLLVYSDAHQPDPTIPEGLPRAEWMKKIENAGMQFSGDVLVVQWGRFGGQQTLADVDAQDPASALRQRLEGKLAVPLAVAHEASERLGGIPAAYAVNMEPGTYGLHYYELATESHGNFHCCAISRDGAEAFLPVVVGNAGGMRFGGLSVEQYAMLSVERDGLIAQMGGVQAVNSPQMGAICQKYGVAFHPGGMAGRINEWEQYIQGDPAFSAQWAMHLGMAQARLAGHEPSEQEMAAIAQRQQYVQGALEQNANRMDQIRDHAIATLRMAANRTPDEVLGFVHQNFASFGVETILHKAVYILREPEEYGRFEPVEPLCEPIIHAHYRSMDADDQKFHSSEKAYFKETRNTIYSSYGLELPGFFNRFFNG